MTEVAVAVLAALAAAVLLPARPTSARASPAAPGAGTGPVAPRDLDAPGRLRRHRLLLALVAGGGAGVVVGGGVGAVLALAVAAGCWWVAGRTEPAGRRERREEVRRTAPHAVALFGAALRAGAAPVPALLLVAEALPGPATDAARGVAARLELGADPAEAWRGLAVEPGLESWGRAMARAHESGAPVVEAVDRLAADLAGTARAEVEDRARTVGVRAALPLGLCLLPAFLLVGIVPLVAGLLGSLW